MSAFDALASWFASTSVVQRQFVILANCLIFIIVASVQWALRRRLHRPNLTDLEAFQSGRQARLFTATSIAGACAIGTIAMLHVVLLVRASTGGAIGVLPRDVYHAASVGAILSVSALGMWWANWPLLRQAPLRPGRSYQEGTCSYGYFEESPAGTRRYFLVDPVREVWRFNVSREEWLSLLEKEGIALPDED